MGGPIENGTGWALRPAPMELGGCSGHQVSEFEPTPSQQFPVELGHPRLAEAKFDGGFPLGHPVVVQHLIEPAEA